jgi:uncharacterized protein (DUF983 family)
MYNQPIQMDEATFKPSKASREKLAMIIATIQGVFRRLWAILTFTCPRCLQGKLFSGLLRMPDHCPVCRLQIEREPGYFTGAMYISYTLAVGSIVPLWLYLLFSDRPLWLTILLPSIQLILTTPLIFRYSRVIWLHLDQIFSPR